MLRSWLQSSKRAIAGAIIVLAGMAVCGVNPAVAETYKIGGLFAVTGPASFLGDPEKKSLEMAVAQINAAGGIDGRLLEVVIYDTEGDPTKAVSSAGRLIHRDRVLAIIGPSLTPTTLAVVPVAERARLPLISCAAGVAITTPIKPWVFKTAQSDVQAVQTIYRYMQARDMTRVGILTVSDAFGESGKVQLEQLAADFGIEVVRSEGFGARDTDMTAQLTRINGSGVDAVICWGTNPGPAVVARNMQQLGLELPLFQSHGVASPRFIELAGDAANGIRLPAGKLLIADLLPDSDPRKSLLLEYINDYQQAFGMPASSFGGYAWDAMGLLAQALKGTNGDREKIRSNLESITNFAGVTGTFNFSPQDHNGLGEDAFVMVRINDGNWEYLH